jgi:hypothetical protein
MLSCHTIFTLHLQFGHEQCSDVYCSPFLLMHSLFLMWNVVLSSAASADKIVSALTAGVNSIGLLNLLSFAASGVSQSSVNRADCSSSVIVRACSFARQLCCKYHQEITVSLRKRQRPKLGLRGGGALTLCVYYHTCTGSGITRTHS